MEDFRTDASGSPILRVTHPSPAGVLAVSSPILFVPMRAPEGVHIPSRHVLTPAQV